MARLILDIDGNLFDRVDAILKRGSYDSFGAFVRVAIENQLQLELDVPATIEPAPLSSDLVGPEVDVPPALLQLRIASLSSTPVVASPLSEDQLFAKSANPQDAYLWGQINRLFPVKIAARELWRLTECGAADLNELQQSAALKARDIGSWIRQIEDARGVRRSDSHWVGLPVGASAEKSVSRYRSHFVGYPRSSDGVFEGALFRLKFAGVVDGGVALTKEGMAWAKLHSPVIDDQLFSEGSLSEAEQRFYIDHVLNGVEEERKPLLETLRIVAEGARTAPAIDTAIGHAHPSWSSNVVTTMRSGNLSRLWELGLVGREGPFGAMTYSVTDSGLRELHR